MKNILGIIGGLGPLASAYFYEMLTNMTEASKDQDHIDTIILSHASIPDRTAYILGESSDSPLPLLLEDVKVLEKMGAKMIAIPCNTSCYFHEELQKSTSVIINNMVDDTVSYLKSKNVKKVAILATTGTIRSNLYQESCKKYQLDYEIPSSENQERVMSIIYDNVKKGVPVDIDKWNRIITSLDADAVILGCTELSVLKEELLLTGRFIDPLEIQARKIIKFFNKKVKGD